MILSITNAVEVDDQGLLTVVELLRYARSSRALAWPLSIRNL